MKAEILARVRAAMSHPTPDLPIERAYRQSGTLNEQERIAQFVSRLEDYNAHVYPSAYAALAGTISRAMNERNKQSLVIPANLPQSWLPSDRQFDPDNHLSYEELDRTEGVLTGCTVAISLTGTIILSHTANEGRRALTLIPDYHLCVVRTDQVVETVPEGLRQLNGVRNRPITTISGPSATADIEMMRVKGVHGPRFLDVILLDTSR